MKIWKKVLHVVLPITLACVAYPFLGYGATTGPRPPCFATYFCAFTVGPTPYNELGQRISFDPHLFSYTDDLQTIRYPILPGNNHSYHSRGKPFLVLFANQNAFIKYVVIFIIMRFAANELTRFAILSEAPESSLFVSSALENVSQSVMKVRTPNPRCASVGGISRLAVAGDKVCEFGGCSSSLLRVEDSVKLLIVWTAPLKSVYVQV